MGVAVGDYDNDGRVDLLTTTFSEDYFPLFRQQAAGVVRGCFQPGGPGASDNSAVGSACGFADFNNDGARDLWLANGHVYPNADQLGSTTYLQPLTIFENRGGRFFPALNAVPGVAKNSFRGGCVGDFNNDGRLDIIVLPIAG